MDKRVEEFENADHTPTPLGEYAARLFADQQFRPPATGLAAGVLELFGFPALLIEEQGKMPFDEKLVDLNDFVPVRNSDKIELVKAKDLQSYKIAQQSYYWGEKFLNASVEVTRSPERVSADAPSTKDLGSTLAELSKLTFKNGLEVKQNADGSFEIKLGVGTSGTSCTIRQNGDVVDSKGKLQGKAILEEGGVIVIAKGASTTKVYKDGTVEKTYQTDYDDQIDIGVTLTTHAHGKFTTREFQLKDKVETVRTYPGFPEETIKMGGISARINPGDRERLIVMTDGTTVWTATASGDLKVTKDGKTETYKAIDAKFTPSEIRGFGTYTFADGTQIFMYKGGPVAGRVVSMSVQGVGGAALKAEWPHNSQGTVYTLTKKK
ncbi:MAG: hypothetical protein K2W95_23705 [Candidatus Obscuribacterales bacterium]|nr:hypothetical protein [Candidatus Obscuribacterales bacterium]